MLSQSLNVRNKLHQSILIGHGSPLEEMVNSSITYHFPVDELEKLNLR